MRKKDRPSLARNKNIEMCVCALLIIILIEATCSVLLWSAINFPGCGGRTMCMLLPIYLTSSGLHCWLWFVSLYTAVSVMISPLARLHLRNMQK